MTDEENHSQDEPLYNIGVVHRVTGIPAATLHAWERRYGFPRSARSSSGRRLYSEKDIARLRWVKAQIDAGMQTRQAIQAVQQLDRQGRLPLSPAAETVPILMAEPTSPISGEQLLEALLRHNLEDADRILAEMLAFSSPEALIQDVMGPALASIGDAWAAGSISIADEHLATSYIRHRLLMWMVTGPETRPVNPVVLACAPEEWHEGGLLMLGVLLRRRGWPVAYLGQAVPLKDLADFCREVNPSAVVLAAMSVNAAHNLADWPKYISQTAGRPLVGFGGGAFINDPKLQGAIPGIYLGSTIQQGLLGLTGFLRKIAE